MEWYDNPHDGGGWVWMLVFMIGFWTLLAALVVLGFVMLRNNRSEGGDRDRDAERLLTERFARGEIDADEYTRSRDLIRSHR